MLAAILSWSGAALILTGGVFSLIGAVGMLRFPDVLTRIHAAGMIDSLGSGLILLGLILLAGWSLLSLKLFLILILLWSTATTATHALGRAIRQAGESPGLPVYRKQP